MDGQSIWEEAMAQRDFDRNNPLITQLLGLCDEQRFEEADKLLVEMANQVIQDGYDYNSSITARQLLRFCVSLIRYHRHVVEFLRYAQMKEEEE
ncbi:MAG: hypothetical protein ABSB63_12660 [Spirochaetia bacterium]|jgi:hypothetical protein